MYQSTAPKTSVSADGALVYSEVPRKSTNMLEYVNELRAGSNLTTAEKNELLDKFASIKSLLLKEKLDEKVKNEIDILFSSLKPSQNNAAKKPFISLKKRSSSDPQYWEYDSENSKSYLNILEDIASNGVSFKGKNVLVTGAGNGSIGVKVVQMLLSGGARVVVSTTRFNRSSTQFFKVLYKNRPSYQNFTFFSRLFMMNMEPKVLVLLLSRSMGRLLSISRIWWIIFTMPWNSILISSFLLLHSPKKVEKLTT